MASASSRGGDAGGKVGRGGWRHRRDRGFRSWQSRPNKAQPTHFVAVRLNSPEIREATARLQRALVARLGEPLLERCLVPGIRLHTALLLIGAEAAQLSKARAACEEAGRSIREFLSGEQVKLVMDGTGHFREKVLYARVRTEPPELLQAMHHLLAHAFLRNGLSVLDPNRQAWLSKGEEPTPFHGHASVLKVSKGVAHSRSKEERWALQAMRLSDRDVACCRDTFFGTHLCTEFELLSMLGSAGDGYYPSLKIEAVSPGAASHIARVPPSGKLLPPGALGGLETAVEEAWASDGDALGGIGREAKEGRGGNGLPACKRQRSAAAASSCKAPVAASLTRKHLQIEGSVFGLDVWPEVFGFLLLHCALHAAAACSGALAAFRNAVRGVKLIASPLPELRHNFLGTGSIVELRDHDAFIGQRAQAALAVDVRYASDMQGLLFGGDSLEALRSGVVAALPGCFGPNLAVVVDTVCGLQPPFGSASALCALKEARPRIVGTDGLTAVDVVGWVDCSDGFPGCKVIVHRRLGRDLEDATHFSYLLARLPSSVQGLDFQDVECPLIGFPVDLLPKCCRAFGTVVLQRDFLGRGSRGNMGFADFQARFPVFPPHVAIVKAALGSDGRWDHPAEVIADAFLRKFPGLAVLQLELSLKGGPFASAADDVPFAGLARRLVARGVQVEVVRLTCKPLQFEFLRAAMAHAGASVQESEAYSFADAKYVWPDQLPRNSESAASA